MAITPAKPEKGEKMNAETKHTPGPWTYRDNKQWGTEETYGQVMAPDGSVVMNGSDFQNGRQKANARLIASAPEHHLNALYLDDIMPDVTDLADDEPVEITITAKAVRDIRAAIAKARGEK